MSENTIWENMEEPRASITLDYADIQEHLFVGKCEHKVYMEFTDVEFQEAGGQLDIILSPKWGHPKIKTRLIINRDVAKKIIEKILE